MNFILVSHATDPAGVHVVLEELHEPSVPQHRERVLMKYTPSKMSFFFSLNASRMMSRHAWTTLSALGNFRMPMVFAGEYSVQSGEVQADAPPNGLPLRLVARLIPIGPIT